LKPEGEGEGEGDESDFEEDMDFDAFLKDGGIDINELDEEE
jgi:hypothetical protein